MDDSTIKIVRSLAADIRFSQVDLINDQVWQLNFISGNPPAVAIQTTFGLRCHGMRIYPRFTVQNTSLTDPHTFVQPPQMIERCPNYLMVKCRPFSSLDVELEYWVPSSQILCGRTQIANPGRVPITFRLEWIADLQPIDNGQPMSVTQIGINTVLQGASSRLFPVFFITGGPEAPAKIYPSLELNITLTPGSSRHLSWALASLDSAEASFTLARQSTALPWEAEAMKFKMEEKRKDFHFASDRQDRDELLHEAQVIARQLLVAQPPPSGRLTLVPKRQPDSPLVPLFTKKRLNPFYSTATAYDVWMLSRILLPGDPELFKDILFSFIDNQQANGAIPWVTALDGSPSKALTPPLLAGVVKDVFPSLNDHTWLSQVYPPLLRSFHCWFNPQTGSLPTWENPLQTGLDRSPQYSDWAPEGQGLDLKTIASPSLLAMLYKECQALLQISHWLNATEEEDWLQTTEQTLIAVINTLWDSKRATYQYADAQTLCSDPAALIHQTNHNGLIKLKRNFKAARRLLIKCTSLEGTIGPINIVIKGMNGSQKIEEPLHFSFSQFINGIARVTSKELFTNLEQIEVNGLRKGCNLELSLAGYDFEDISLFLPLWAGIPSAVQAKELVEHTLLSRYLSPDGLTCLPSDKVDPHKNLIIPFWNYLMIEGLLLYGYKEAAANVMKRLLDTLVKQWQASGFVNSVIQSSDGVGIGEKDTLAGLPALLPFLRVLGIERITPKEVILSGLNEFFSPITVQYERVTIQTDQSLTCFQTLNGSKVEIRESVLQKIVLP